MSIQEFHLIKKDSQHVFQMEGLKFRYKVSKTIKLHN